MYAYAVKSVLTGGHGVWSEQLLPTARRTPFLINDGRSVRRESGHAVVKESYILTNPSVGREAVVKQSAQCLLTALRRLPHLRRFPTYEGFPTSRRSWLMQCGYINQGHPVSLRAPTTFLWGIIAIRHALWTGSFRPAGECGHCCMLLTRTCCCSGRSSNSMKMAVPGSGMFEVHVKWLSRDQISLQVWLLAMCMPACHTGLLLKCHECVVSVIAGLSDLASCRSWSCFHCIAHCSKGR